MSGHRRYGYGYTSEVLDSLHDYVLSKAALYPNALWNSIYWFLHDYDDIPDFSPTGERHLNEAIDEALDADIPSTDYVVQNIHELDHKGTILLTRYVNHLHSYALEFYSAQKDSNGAELPRIRRRSLANLCKNIAEILPVVTAMELKTSSGDKMDESLKYLLDCIRPLNPSELRERMSVKIGRDDLKSIKVKRPKKSVDYSGNTGEMFLQSYTGHTSYERLFSDFSRSYCENYAKSESARPDLYAQQLSDLQNMVMHEKLGISERTLVSENDFFSRYPTTDLNQHRPKSMLRKDQDAYMGSELIHHRNLEETHINEYRAFKKNIANVTGTPDSFWTHRNMCKKYGITCNEEGVIKFKYAMKKAL